MIDYLRLPNYAKYALLIVGFYFLISMLYIAQGIILPILYAAVFAISLSPLVNFLIRKKFNRIIAISLVLLLVSVIVIATIAMVASQASRLSTAWPQLYIKLQELFAQIVSWTSNYFDIAPQKINAWLVSASDDIINSSKGAIGSALSTIGGILTFTVIIPVYIFMILLYQPQLLLFTQRIFAKNGKEEVANTLTDIKGIIQSYLTGLFLEFVIVAILNSAGLLLLGIEYAILLGIIGSLLNVIPYIGGLIGVAMFMIVALLTKPPVYVLYVIILYGVIQLVDNNYIVPKVVGSKVKLNALFSIIAVIVGAALWGISGMFLSIPLIAIIKLILDRTPASQTWGYLLGDPAKVK
jgi:predicted PurR-regulated permease PerM